MTDRKFTTQSAAQRFANNLNHQQPEAFWVIGHDANAGWFVENMEAFTEEQIALASFKQTTHY